MVLRKGDVKAEPGEGAAMGASVRAVIRVAMGMVCVFVVCLGSRVIDFGHGFLGVSEGPFGVIKGRIGRLDAGRDAETPVAIKDERCAERGGIKTDISSWLGNFSLRRADIGVGKRKSRRPMGMIIGIRVLR